jgi:hypothetical protein
LLKSSTISRNEGCYLDDVPPRGHTPDSSTPPYALRNARQARCANEVIFTSTTGALDYEGKRQAMSDLSLWVAVYPSWHESNYRWVMCAFEDRDGERGWWFDGDKVNEAPASGAASPSQPANRKSPRIPVARRTEPYSSACAAIRPGTPLPLRWTSDSVEPAEAA